MKTDEEQNARRKADGTTGQKPSAFNDEKMELVTGGTEPTNPFASDDADDFDRRDPFVLDNVDDLKILSGILRS